MGEIFAFDKAIVIDEVIAVMLQSMRPMIPMRSMIPTQMTRPLRPIRPMKPVGPVRLMRLTKQMRLTRQIQPTRPMGFISSMRPMCLSKLLETVCLAMFIGPKRPMPTRPTRINKIYEAIAGNVPIGSNVSNAPWVDMADANKSNDGRFDSLSSASFPLFVFSQSPSQNIAKTFAKVNECFGKMGCDNKLNLPVVQHGKSGRWSPCSLRIKYANNLGNQHGMDLFDVWGSLFS